MSDAAICAVHLSRFAEEIVLWTTAQFGFARLSDRIFDGLLDHAAKAQPGCGRTGARQIRPCHRRATGLLIVMKGLPLAYSKDMQEDKEGAFDALQTLSLSIAAMAGMVRDLEPDLEKMKAAAGDGYHNGDRLGRLAGAELKMPFREAHHVTGKLVALASGRNIGLQKLSLDELQSVEPRITKEIYDVLGVENSVKSRTSYGGTAPKNVRAQAKRWLARLAKEKSAT